MQLVETVTKLLFPAKDNNNARLYNRGIYLCITNCTWLQLRYQGEMITISFFAGLPTWVCSAHVNQIHTRQAFDRCVLDAFLMINYYDLLQLVAHILVKTFISPRTFYVFVLPALAASFFTVINSTTQAPYYTPPIVDQHVYGS